MSTTSLTAKYRPQTFAQVAGQDSIKSILARAAAKDKVAPAYLFSGTRGVGKTTIARIFAKALNCENAPASEPCNQCSHCKQATAGVAVDVIEIDAASHGKVDDARRLKEDIGYAPLESRYKVFIIDEAHMLTTQAFNALLKTLEEPPPRVTFILATTEAHKFPATILSRCQHYTFKTLTQVQLIEHLESILNQEGVEFEPGAVQIVAKRGAGSVRDSMSILAQALALGGEKLLEIEVRSFLGLAGQDVFFSLVESIQGRDLVAVGRTLRQVLDQGLDLGFFLRELTNCWRNMFMLRQAGKDALELLGLAGEEADTWLDWSAKFHPAHIHACWQMTLEGQRRVMTSLEPALALELLLLNLACLPELMNLDQGIASGTGSASGTGGASGSGSASVQGKGGSSSPAASSPAGSSQGSRSRANKEPSDFQASTRQRAEQPPRQEAVGRESVPDEPASRQHERQEPAPSEDMPPEPPPPTNMYSPSEPSPEQQASQPAASSGPEAEPADDADRPEADGPKNWEGFLEYAKRVDGEKGFKMNGLAHVQGRIQGTELFLVCTKKYQHKKMCEEQTLVPLKMVLRGYLGRGAEVRVELDEAPPPKTREELAEEAVRNEAVKNVMENFNAGLTVIPRDKD